jgi:hypothetical protein
VSVRERFGGAALALVLATAGALDAAAAAPTLITTAPSGSGAPALPATPTTAATAATAAGDETGQQVDAWIARDGAPPTSASGSPQLRTVHGEVGAGFGSNGESNIYGVADIPVGQTGDFVVAVSNVTGRVRGGRYGDYASGGGNLALGFYMSGSDASAPACGRQRWDQMQAPTWQASASPGVLTCGGSPPPP